MLENGRIQVLTREFLLSFDRSQLKFVYQVIIYFDMTEVKFVWPVNIQKLFLTLA